MKRLALLVLSALILIASVNAQEKYDKALCKFFTEEQYEGYKKLKPQFYSQRRIKDFLLQ